MKPDGIGGCAFDSEGAAYLQELLEMVVGVLRSQTKERNGLDHVDHPWLEFEALPYRDLWSGGNVLAGWDRELSDGLLSHVGWWRWWC